jgi:hypothetical protein
VAAAVRAVQHGCVVLRVLSPGFAWALVGVLAVIAVAVGVAGRLSAAPAPPVHVWQAHLLPYIREPRVVPSAHLLPYIYEPPVVPPVPGR